MGKFRAHNASGSQVNANINFQFIDISLGIIIRFSFILLHIDQIYLFQVNLTWL